MRKIASVLNVISQAMWASDTITYKNVSDKFISTEIFHFLASYSEIIMLT